MRVRYMGGVVRAVLLAVAIAAPAVANAQARADTTFNTGGLVPLPWTRSDLRSEVMAMAPDGGTFMVHETEQDLIVVRLNARGTFYSDYVGAGIARVSLAERFGLSAILVAPDGALVLGGGRDLMRIDATGRLDKAFGKEGRIRVPYVTNGACADSSARRILPLPGGGWMLVGSRLAGSAPGEIACTLIARLRADGQPDLTYGVQGNITRPNLATFDAVLRPGDGIELIGRYANNVGSWAERIQADGTMLESYGTRGSLELPRNGPQFLGNDGVILADGSRIFVAASAQSTLLLHRYRADDSFDPRFAGVGRTVIPSRDGSLLDPRVLPLADGGFIIRAIATPPGQRFAVFHKVEARGQSDPMFGDLGYARHYATNLSQVGAWIAQPDGYVVFNALSFTTIPVAPAFTTVTAHAARIQAVPDIVEFFNTFTRHYFMAYDGLEAEGIDSGVAGPGWVRTNQSFHPGGETPACRFFAPGPNTHFFTAEPVECEQVKRSPGWIFEGLGFYVTRLTDGACPEPLVAVFRFYNNRAHLNDSNHRYVKDLSVLPAMQAQGWTLEGRVFCAKP